MVLAHPGTKHTALSTSSAACAEPPAPVRWHWLSYQLPGHPWFTVLPWHTIPPRHTWLATLPLQSVRAELRLCTSHSQGAMGLACPKAEASSVGHMLTTCPGSPGAPGGPCDGQMTRNQPTAEAVGKAVPVDWVGGTYHQTRWPWRTRQPHAALRTRQSLQGEQWSQRGDATLAYLSGTAGAQLSPGRGWVWGGSPGCQHQVPLDHPVGTEPVSVLLIPFPATITTALSLCPLSTECL